MYQKGWFWLYLYRFRRQEVTLPPLSRPGWPRSLPQFVILLLAVAFTLASLRYIRPAYCLSYCDAEPCPPGSCRCGEQGAGFPFFVISDNNCGSSPTGGWGRVGPEDMSNPIGFLFNVLFYAGILWLLWLALRWVRRLPEPYFALVLIVVAGPSLVWLVMLYPLQLQWLTPLPPVPDRLLDFEPFNPSQAGPSLVPTSIAPSSWTWPSEMNYATSILYSASQIERVIEYGTNQPVDRLRRLYATELPKEGWRLECTLGRLGAAQGTPWTNAQLRSPCDFFLFAPGIELIDVYERDGSARRKQILGVFIFEKGTSSASRWHRDSRLVQLREFR